MLKFAEICTRSKQVTLKTSGNPAVRPVQSKVAEVEENMQIRYCNQRFAAVLRTTSKAESQPLIPFGIQAANR